MLMNIFAMNSLALTWSHLGPDRGGRERERETGEVDKLSKTGIV